MLQEVYALELRIPKNEPAQVALQFPHGRRGRLHDYVLSLSPFGNAVPIRGHGPVASIPERTSADRFDDESPRTTSFAAYVQQIADRAQLAGQFVVPFGAGIRICTPDKGVLAPSFCRQLRSGIRCSLIRRPASIPSPHKAQRALHSVSWRVSTSFHRFLAFPPGRDCRRCSCPVR